MTDGEGNFWTRRAYAAAAVLFFVRAPYMLSAPSTAQTLGRLLGGVVSALAVVWVAKKAYLRYS